MKIYDGYNDLNLKNPVVTIGIFDGVHLGHIAILETLVRRSRDIGGESVVITFDPHPEMILKGKAENHLFLSTMDEKKILLERAGADHLIIIQFTSGFSKMPASDFIENILIGKIGTKHLIVGYDHHFGYHGGGNFNTVKDYAAGKGFIVERVEGFKSNGLFISSSLIRTALLNGRLDEANKWLGYNYSLKGIVVEGRKLGREIGFPTANIQPYDKNKLVPANGVYVVEALTGGRRLKGISSIGTNPTINTQSGIRSIEVHIFNFDGDIYGNELEIIFRYRLRDEMKFKNTNDLARQIRIDKDNAMKLPG